MDRKTINNCIIVIDKPNGQICHEVTSFVKKITDANRSGHAGTLDPNVSGVLPVALGKATKLLRYIAGKDKTYIGIIKFKRLLPREEIEKLFLDFTGEIYQTPPKISAVRKVRRKRHIHHLKLLELNGRLALFETTVDAGTYIRTLCEDIGKKCGGARMEELRRTAVGNISETQSHTMQELIDAVWFWKNKNDSSMLEKMLMPPEMFIELPKVFINKNAVEQIFSGAQVMVPAVERFEDTVEVEKPVIIYCEQKFIGIGIAKIRKEDLQKKKKGLAVKLERVHKI
ncbi:RNA-guided pseudouridylation complex pseudouridine synthase subunit Cbf5 [Candidatus Micrarchaeota archaeon]|nr:RNA-guided pseudouridylation complex pseudouridine synthase subunit Cbf5 [Candidatus Micrarchaeota archaeon]MBU1165966.1 RNA-guided pseudouridylation complex pseudouridine synthase subunit Cbf5 [Candidatus Micrarchaeota archaeon]MBU1886870.1 RNA-guided pseudouridylation complex pseudouridine synthase subunit Cbf5 [Candidatus Micrarchaeota archaeon]